MNSPDVVRFVEALESPDGPCPSCAYRNQTHAMTCPVQDLLSFSTPLTYSNRNFRSITLDNLQEHSGNVQFLDGVCHALTTRVVYGVLGVGESEMAQIIEGRTVFGMWVNTHLVMSSVFFFNNIDASSARKVATVKHALELYAGVKRTGGINYQMLEPRKLTLVQVLGHFLKWWVKSNRKAIRSCIRDRRALERHRLEADEA